LIFFDCLSNGQHRRRALLALRCSGSGGDLDACVARPATFQGSSALISASVVAFGGSVNTDAKTNVALRWAALAAVSNFELPPAAGAAEKAWQQSLAAAD
jgi:hypothetical protein